MTRAEPRGGRRRGVGPEERRRRREQAFGDALPDRTTDDSDVGEPADPVRSRDDWLRDQVPPHHG